MSHMNRFHSNFADLLVNFPYTYYVFLQFGIEDLKKCPNQTECWDGVRNYQVHYSLSHAGSYNNKIKSIILKLHTLKNLR